MIERSDSLKARQIRAARALADWSQEDLASAAGLSIATIRKLELGYISPRSKTTNFIRQAFEDSGLEFLEPDGVRHRPEHITIYQGQDGARDFFDDVYQTVLKKKGDLVVVRPEDDDYFIQLLGDYRQTHIERMTAIRNRISVKCILTEDESKMAAAGYCDYRKISKHYVNSVPFYVYNDKYAIIVLGSNPSPKITVIQSKTVADAFRQQFYSMWEKATPLNVTGKDEGSAKRKGSRR